MDFEVGDVYKTSHNRHFTIIEIYKETISIKWQDGWIQLLYDCELCEFQKLSEKDAFSIKLKHTF
jgi:hypothetical protein